ncbi:MAG TPA: hypothetical protein VGB91_12285 [Rhizomicrobium sp.]
MPLALAQTYIGTFASAGSIGCASDPSCSALGSIQLQSVTYGGLAGTAICNWVATCAGTPDGVFYVRPSGATTGCFTMNGFAPSQALGNVVTKNTGTSVADPGTGALEQLAPYEASSTGASKTFGGSDLWKKTRRSNSGTAMMDTFPVSSATGLTNGTQVSVVNADATANDTITAGAGTTFAGGSTVVLGAGRGVLFTYDTTGGTPTWRANNNDLTALTAPGGYTNPYFPNVGLMSALTANNWATFAYTAAQPSGINITG